jgi:valyl-tRNA synthetase
MSLPSNYRPEHFEQVIYSLWQEQHVGTPEEQVKMQAKYQNLSQPESYCILMPPPNLTGSLHTGHAFQHYLMDTLSRRKRLQGTQTLWYPGVDHAGIQLEGVIDKLINKGEFVEVLQSVIPESVEANDKAQWLKSNQRDLWLQCAWSKVSEWRDRQKDQSAILGDTPDYDRTLFTLDERATRMVMHSFDKYWQDGLIYKGEYLVNWSVGLQTALSDFQSDIEWVEQKDPLVTFEYVFKEFRLNTSELKEKYSSLLTRLKDTDDFPALRLSTVRPETKFTDLAVAMHPDKFDTYFNPDSYFEPGYDTQLSQAFMQAVKNQEIEVYYHLPPLQSAPVKLVLSEKVDASFGTGILKITPGHDQFDYDLYHEFVQQGILPPGMVQTCIGRDGKLVAEYCGEFAGLTVLHGRMLVIKRLLEVGYIPLKDGEEEILPESYTSDEDFLKLNYQQQIKLLEDAYPNHMVDWNYTHNVLYCERSKTPVEPLISTEYFLSYHQESKELGKNLATIGLEGIAQTQFFPEEMRDRAINILNNVHDWCISRKLVWGHRIPVWYNLTVNPTQQFVAYEDMNKNYEVDIDGQLHQITGSDKMQVSVHKPETAGNWIQEEKVFDTWFSSCLWPLTTLNFYDTLQGLENTDFDTYYSTQVLVTGGDIFYSWIVRMILLCTYWTGRTPFKHLVITPTILDEKGKKMSKSLGNGLQPEEAIAKYSSDALRLSVLSGMIPGRNMRLGGAIADNLCEKYRNFGNKVWNVARFLEQYENQYEGQSAELSGKSQ